jgi:hypothetical protein
MKSKRVEHRVPSALGAFRLLSPEEIDSLRNEMKAASRWMKHAIAHRRLQRADSIAIGQSELPGGQKHDAGLSDL